jgi:membrane protein DedA with SNARE-associated domain
MTETLFGYVSDYGLPVIAIAAYFSCLAVPIPTFAIMLSGGAFAASGDLILWQVMVSAYMAALLGDQSGFQIGRWGGPIVIENLERNPNRAAVIAKAKASVDCWGGLGIFFSTWLFAPLGPWVNLIAGASGMSRHRFFAWDAAGEAIWVTAYVSLGYVFGSHLPELAELVGDWAGLVTFAGITMVIGLLLVRAAVKHVSRSK